MRLKGEISHKPVEKETWTFGRRPFHQKYRAPYTTVTVPVLYNDTNSNREGTRRHGPRDFFSPCDNPANALEECFGKARVRLVRRFKVFRYFRTFYSVLVEQHKKTSIMLPDNKEDKCHEESRKTAVRITVRWTRGNKIDLLRTEYRAGVHRVAGISVLIVPFYWYCIKKSPELGT